MPTSSGPNIAGESNLVFAYDTGDVKNSYVGEPTVNLAGTDAARTIEFHNQGAYGNAGSVSDAPEKGQGWKKITITNRGNNFRIAQFPYTSLPGSVTYTYSLEVDMGTTSGYYWRIDGSGGYDAITIVNNKVVTTITPSAGSYAIFLNHNTTGVSGISEVIYYRYYQVENKTKATQFTTGTRSATQGLLPLIGNTSLDLSTISFDSNAQIIFDGSDDRILTSGNIILNGSQTFEAIATISGGPQSPAGIISNHDYENTSNFGLNHISNNKIGISIGYTDGTREYDSKYTTYAATVGTPFHLVMTFDQPSNTVKLYINGALDSTFVLTKTVKFTSRPVVLGRWDYQYNYYYFNGKIPVAKVYNRALTAQEVKQNYQQKKTRFNLS